MKKLSPLVAATALFAMAGVAHSAGVSVNIASPISGSSVSNYFYSSFTTTCPGGQYSVTWYLDSTLVGSGTFYNTAGVHFAHKLPTGGHSLTVKSSCGYDVVKFNVL